MSQPMIATEQLVSETDYVQVSRLVIEPHGYEEVIFEGYLPRIGTEEASTSYRRSLAR